MKRFLQRLFGFSLGPILGAAISLIQVPILTYYLSTTEYGKAGLFQNMILMIPTFIYIGIDQAYTREYHQATDRRRLMQQAMVIPMMVGLLMMILFILFDDIISTFLFGTPEYTYIVWFAAVWVLATIIERFVLLTIRMEERALEYSLLTFLLKVGTFIVSLLLIFAGWTDFRVIVYGLLFGQLIVDIGMFIRYRHLLDISGLQFDWPLIRSMFYFGLPLMIAGAMSSVLNGLDQTFLRIYGNFTDNGVYSVGLRIAGVVGIIKTAFTSFWVPTAYRWYEEKKSMKHYKYISDVILLLLTALFYVILLLKEPIGWFLSFQDPNYNQVKYIIGLLVFPPIMYTLSETTTLGIVFSKKTHYNIYISFLTIIPNVLINLILTPTLGYKGAALASTIAYIMFYLARTYYSKKTGFYFEQKKHIMAIMVMTIAGILNAFEIPYIELITLILMVMTFAVQIATIKTTLEIKNNSQDWDFN
ncbi:oligosaccharide flippase family protein [Aerococcaceae bacterium DSM 111020]|nr:oligosaccharide flippase family protein [Aerococcaceae bacterium DSM 111020]